MMLLCSRTASQVQAARSVQFEARLTSVPAIDFAFFGCGFRIARPESLARESEFYVSSLSGQSIREISLL